MLDHRYTAITKWMSVLCLLGYYRLVPSKFNDIISSCLNAFYKEGHLCVFNAMNVLKYFILLLYHEVVKKWSVHGQITLAGTNSYSPG